MNKTGKPNLPDKVFQRNTHAVRTNGPGETRKKQLNHDFGPLSRAIAIGLTGLP